MVFNEEPRPVIVDHFACQFMHAAALSEIDHNPKLDATRRPDAA